MIRTRMVVLALMMAAAAACAPKRGNIPTGVTEPDKYLWEQGKKSLDDRKWFTAREYFQQLVDNYPQSPLRADAKLGLGDAYLSDGTTEGKLRAEREFQEFLSFFPTHQRADYAQYKLGMTHFDQMPKAERDQTETKAALDQFQAFRERYPNSQLLPEVREKERVARDRMSESIYKVGYFYHKARWYPGGISRFRQVLQEDPQFTNRDAVYFYLAEAYVALKREAEALPLLEKLGAEFEQSEFLAKGSTLREQVKSTLANQTPGAPAGSPETATEKPTTTLPVAPSDVAPAAPAPAQPASPVVKVKPPTP
ncbi:MAG TPA: outer membrane protein assembly factor BamD [Luteitalea sp.]|nr:outer membrane protein assembly factor BamD [Luteitalea sp.]